MSTFLLVHGAWHGGWCWFKVAPLLEARGHRVLAPDLPSHGIDRTPIGAVSLETYAQRICEILDGCEEPVVLVGHSMGGLVVSRAAELRPAKVRTLVYVAAFLLRDGQSLLDILQAQAESPSLPHLRFNSDHSATTLNPDSIRAIFYDDCSASDVALARSLLVPQPMAVQAAPLRISAEHWGSVPRVYIECERDNAIPIAAQRAMQSGSPCKRVITLSTGHSPFFAAPAELARHLADLGP
jgi:pimeloyl-ACP methyl ester carboxylesterase